MILIDAHTHIYPCYNLDDFIFSAFKNLFRDRFTSNQTPDTAVLFLTETANFHYFRMLKSEGNRADSFANPETWRVVNTEERLSLQLEHSGFPGKKLIMISGQQVVTLEKLEILSVGCQYPQPNGASLRNTANSIFSGNGLAVLPWGVGKWLGKRGRIVDNFVATEKNPCLFLGDNSSRPVFWGEARLKRNAEPKWPRLLSGTDPLPLRGEEKRVGSFGTIIHGTIDAEKPLEALIELLSSPETETSSYGTLQSPLSFIKQQVALRMAR